jgi:fermentation-respiration switch protein FrsA (DUF1100 family)
MNLVVGFTAALILVAVLIRLLEKRFIFFPPRYPEGFDPAANTALSVEDVWITASDGVKLSAWYLPNPASSIVLLWFHGNAENIGHGLEQMKTFARLGVNVLELDYRGYGKSGGSPDEMGVYRDAEAAYQYLVATRNFQPRNIFIYGHSLGGAVAIDLASRRECGGLIVESTFTRGREMARRMLLVPFLEYVPQSRFDSLTKIARVRAPVLVTHGVEDTVVPFSMGQRLFQAAPEPKYFLPVEGAGHNDVFQSGRVRYLDRLKMFIDGASSVSGAAKTLSGRPS